MALVAYDNSDSSEFEDDDNESATVVIPNPKVEGAKLQPSTSQPSTNCAESETGGLKLFNLLPLPSSTKKSVVVEEDDEFLHKKAKAANIVKPKAKITVPSLSEFKDVEDRPTAKPKALNGKKSGLLSMLPQPKNASKSTTTSFLPHVLKNKPLVPSSVKKKAPLPSPAKKVKSDTQGLVNSYSDESDNEDGGSTDFFSINKPVEEPMDIPLDIETNVKPVLTEEEKKRATIESFFKKDVPEQVDLEPDDSSQEMDDASAYYGAESYEPAGSSSNGAVLDDEAFHRLVGSRGKRKKENIHIVDIDQKEVLADAQEMFRRGLLEDTSTRVSVRKKGNEPTNQQKRKHQITYLAHQAKAKESELQTQWANNRQSKRQTQSKYGF